MMKDIEPEENTNTVVLYGWWFSEYQGDRVFDASSVSRKKKLCICGWTFTPEKLGSKIFVKSAPIVQYLPDQNLFVSDKGTNYFLKDANGDYLDNFPTCLIDVKRLITECNTK